MRLLLVLLGFFFVAVGFVGIVVPGLPTTPFLLLAAYFFVRSSPKHYQWLINHKTFGPFINDFIKKGGITLRIKIIAIVFMWMMISASVLIFISNLSVKIIVLIAGLIGTTVVLSVKTIKQKKAMTKLKIILATRNKNKIEEIRKATPDDSVTFLSLFDFPEIADVSEDQDSFEGNSLKKAKEVFEASGFTALSDDSGLEVEFLKGAPGVYSARYAGEKADYDANNRKLLHELKDVPPEKRKAQFRCVMTLYGENIFHQSEGLLKGEIIFENRGKKGFGYDPIFIPEGYDRTLAEMSMQEKNSISHRAIALRKMMLFIKTLQQSRS